MEFSTTIQNEVISFVQEPVQHNSMGAAPGRTLYTAHTDAVTIASLYIPGDGFTIWRTDYSFHRQVAVAIRSSDPVLMLHFIFGDAIRLSVNGAPFLLRDRQFNLSYFPSFDAIAQAGKRPALHTVHIHLKPAFLERIINGSEILLKFLDVVKYSGSTSLSELKHYTTPEILSNIFDIFHNPYRGKNAELFTAAQVHLLLLRAADRINSDRRRKDRIGLTAEDVEKLNAVRDYMVQHKTEAVTIQYLARMSGINATKLKKGFNQLFGTPVIAYHEYLRLDEARRLLTETGLTVTEVAYAVGYLSVSHFSDAFKRAFHSSPVHYKRRK